MISQRRNFRVVAGLVAVTALAAAITVPCNAATFLWSVASPGLNDWNNDVNWTPNTGSPGASDTAVFSPIGTTSQGSINNIVSVDTTVTGLTFTNVSSGTWHVTQIPTNVTLAVTGNMVVGAISNFVNSGAADGSFNTTVQILDAGTLVVHGNLTVGDSGTNGASSGSTLDLSGLTNFVDTNITGTFALGFGTRSGANMKLAAVSNYITAGNMNLNSGSSSSSASGTFTLGSGTNIINVNNFNVGGQRSSCTVTFPNSGGLRLRGTNATDTSRASMTLGFRQASGSGGTTTGTLSLNGQPVDMKIGTLIVGWATNVTGNIGNGTINFDTGIIDATNILLGTTRSAGCTATGTINVGGSGELLIGAGGLTLGNLVAGTAATGNLNVNGGSVVASGNIVKGTAAGVGNISFSSGTLTIGPNTIGTASLPIDNLSLSGATVHLNVDGNANGADINVNTLSANGPTTITIDSVANVTIPVLLHLISYNAGGGDQFSGFTLGTLPNGYSATLIDNSGSIDLSIGPSGITVTPLLWVGAVGSTLNSSWDLSTMNWLDTNGNPVAYSNPDFVHFDDTASNSIVTLTTTNLTPSVLTFTNQGAASGGLDYVLNGPGAIEGTVSFFKDGMGSVTLAQSGGDNFSGGVTVNNGTVILDDANSDITGGFNINNSATLQVGNNNDANGNIPPGDALNNGTLVVNQSINEQVTNPISGFGSLTKLGNGTLTLTGTNGYTGNTFVFGGTLALSGAGTVSNSASVVVSNATLDVTGVSGKALFASLNTSNSALDLGVSANLSVPVNIVNGSWTLGGSTNVVNISALPPIASYPTTLTIAQAVSGVSGFNLGLGTVPTGSPNFEGSISLSSDNTTVFLTLTNGPISVRSSVLWVGTNNISATTNWSDNSNWQLPGAPTFADNVVFAQNGSVSGSPFNSVGDGRDGIVNPGNLNNIVDTTMTVGTLLYTNVGGTSSSQNTLITNGATLNIVSNGSLTIGNTTLDFGAGATEFVTIAGTNGTLNINNTNGTTYVGLGNSTNGSELATLDLSGLGTLNASVSRFLVGVGSGAEGISISRTAGIVYLAQTNIITAYLASGSSETSDTIANTMTFNVGEDDGNAGLPSALYLGQSNAIMADAVGTGREKSGAGMAFNPNLVTGNTRPAAYFRGANAAAVATWSIGDQVVNSGSGENANGTNDFTGGHVDALVNSLYVGRASGNATSTGTSSGTLTFDDGIFNVTTAFVGLQPTNSVKITTGTVNVKTNNTSGTFATLLISGNLSLGMSATGGTAATGNLNIDGGTVEVGTILCGGNNSVTVGASGFGGVLAVNNALGAPGASLNALNLDGDTILSLPASNTAPAVVNALTIDGQVGTTNVLNISSVQGTVTPPMELPIIQYTTLNNTGGNFNMGLGTLPAGYSGFFTNDTTHSTIGVVITSAPVSGPSTNADITDVSLSGTNLVVHGTNNNVPNTNFQYVVLVSTNVAMPLSNWMIVTTNSFNQDGTFDYTNPIVPGTPRQFIDVKVVP